MSVEKVAARTLAADASQQLGVAVLESFWASRAALIAIRAVLADRGVTTRPDLEPPALAGLLSNAALSPPPGVTELLGIEGPDPGRDESLAAASRAVAWSAAALRVI